jgi:acyl-CoA dehydrogenase
MWEFSTEPEFQEKLDWMARFVREEVEPLDLLFPGAGDPYDTGNAAARAILAPLQEQVKAQGLWACHLGPELGGPGYGQLKLALMNEILGRSYWAPTVFGTAAPDTGNAEILALFGTPEQQGRYLQPLLDGTIVSSFSMTEPHAGADPKEFTCRAWRDGGEWVIDGEKWFTSNARYAAFLIVMAVTDPDAAPHERMSMFIVPAETPGVEIKRNVATMAERDDLDEGIHGYIRYRQVRVPADAMLGGPGQGFKVAQARLGGGRVHHAMRTVGQCRDGEDLPEHRGAGPAPARVARHHRRDAAGQDVDGRALAGARGRADRSTPGHHRQAAAARLLPGRRPVPQRAHPAQARRRPGEVRAHPQGIRAVSDALADADGGLY